MDCHQQLEALRDVGEHPHFIERVLDAYRSPLRAENIWTLQINTGKRCNLFCKHCHVEAGPDRPEVMPREVLAKCLDVIRDAGIPAVDITGGSPEMNPSLEWFLDEVSPIARRVTVRSNCAILLQNDYNKFIDAYSRNRVEVITSLPDWREAKTDRVRGQGIFARIIGGIKELNRRGYGIPGSGLLLNIAHNPAGAYLPGSQASLEHEYHTRLESGYGIFFNSLYCITNIPVGRYLEFLLKSGNYCGYIRELCVAFNPSAMERVMCKTMLSVGWDGALFDCDFNQMLGLQVSPGSPSSIFEFDMEKLRRRDIVVNNHCYGCVAGAGSSCGGATI